MKAFKFLSAIVIISLAIFLSCLEVKEVMAADSIRVGVFELNFQAPEVDLSKVSMFTAASIYKRHDAGKRKYTKFFMDILSKSDGFSSELIKVSDREYIESFSSSSRYNRSMTNNNLSNMSAEEIAERHKALFMKKARTKKCNYTAQGGITFERSPKNEVVANANITIINIESDKTFSFFSTVKIPFSAKSAKKSKSKSSKDSSITEESAREQAATIAFNKIIKYFSYEITGDYPRIINITGDNIIINKGSDSFMDIGDKFSVFITLGESENLNDIFGESQQNSGVQTLAVIEIKSVEKDSSTAEIISGLGNISTLRPNDKLHPESKMTVDNYISRAKQDLIFPNTRPEPAKIAVVPAPSKEIPVQSVIEPISELPPGMIRVGIINFDSKAYGISKKEASTLADLLSRMLSNSDKIAVLERSQLEAIAREQKLTLSGLIDPAQAAQIGKLASCQYILLGSITGCEERDIISGRYINPTERANFSQFYKPGMSSKAQGILMGLELIVAISEAVEAQKENVVTETHEVITEIDARLINVETSQIIMSLTERGSAAQSDIITQDGNGQIKHIEANYGDLENRAIASTAANLSQRIREKLADEFVQITSINDGEIIINRGSSSGIQTGDLFCVYSEGQSGGDTEAIISIKDVQEAFSIGEIAKSIYESYSPIAGCKLEPVLHSDFQRGIWHIKNQRRSQAKEENKYNISLEQLSIKNSKKKRLENASTDTKKVIKSYGLNLNAEKNLINLHTKASKASTAKKKYDAYRKISDSNMNDYLAAYNTGRYALEQSMYIEAREWASKALFVNPNYIPAKNLIDKIDSGE